MALLCPLPSSGFSIVLGFLAPSPFLPWSEVWWRFHKLPRAVPSEANSGAPPQSICWCSVGFGLLLRMCSPLLPPFGLQTAIWSAAGYTVGFGAFWCLSSFPFPLPCFSREIALLLEAPPTSLAPSPQLGRHRGIPKRKPSLAVWSPGLGSQTRRLSRPDVSHKSLDEKKKKRNKKAKRRRGCGCA